MNLIAHRINTVAELKKIPPEYGVEIDLRDKGDRLILQHNPFTDGEDFAEYLKHYQHGTLILNIKSERIEDKVLALINEFGVTDYFFLDSSFPMIYQLSEKGEKNIAVRFSEFEGLDTILAVKERVRWVWVDCFTKLPINPENYRVLKQAGFKLCLVSPELLGRDRNIEKYKDYLEREKIVFDAICTKFYNFARWK